MIRQIDLVARRRHFSRSMTQQTCERGYRFVRFVAELHAQQFFDVADGHAAAHDQTAVRFAHHIRRWRLSTVSAFADDLFHQVFHGRNARHSSMLIDDYCQRLPLLAHFTKQLRTNLRFRDEKDWFNQFTHLALQQVLVRDLHQGFDSLFRALLLGLLGLVLGNPRQRFRSLQEYAHRPNEPHRPANQRQQRKQSAPRRAVQQHVWNKVHGDDDFERQKNAELHERLPGPRNEVHDAARRLQHQERQQEVPEDSEGPPAAAAVDFQLGLDLLFKNFEIFVY